MKQSYGQLPARMNWGPAIGLAVAAIAVAVVVVFALGMLDRRAATPPKAPAPAAAAP